MKQYGSGMKYIVSLLFFLCVAFACTEKDNIGQAGYLYVGVDEDNTTITRSKPVTDEELRVDIISSARDTVRSYTDYITQVYGKKLVLPAGSYKVVVSSSKDGGAAWEMPFYLGSEDVEIKADEITQMKVTCQITNTKVSVRYIGLDEYFTDYCDTVSTNAGTLVYAKDEYRAGYFTSEGDLTAHLYLRNKDGNEFTLKKVIRDIKPRYHYSLKYKVDPEQGGDAGGDIDITVDDGAETVEYTIKIREDELAKGEPEFKTTGFDEKKSVSYQPIVDGKPNIEEPNASILLKVPAGIKELKVLPTSAQFTEEIVWTGTAWSDTRFPELTAVEGVENTYNLDFAGIMKTVLQPNGKKPATHTFAFTMLDNLNQEKSITINIVIKADVKVLTEAPVVWSTFAVLRGSAGDPGKSSFMIREQGGQDIPVTKIKINSETSFSALVTGLEAGKTYEYYAVSGEDKGAEESFTVETISEVPNLGFDEWGTRNGNVDAPLVGGNKEYICLLGNNVDGKVYWESGNRGAVVGSGNPVLTNASTDVVNEGNSIKSARFASTWAGAVGIGAFSAGSIFSGDIEYAGQSGAKLKYGQPHNGFPTALKGWYKYTPGPINWTHNKENGSGTDKAIIAVALSTKIVNVHSLTASADDQNNKFRKNSDGVFAYGELIIDKEVKDYTAFEVPFIYMDDKMPDAKTPVYIIIMASSSKDGDVFTGSTSSVMHVDEFSLVYTYDSKCLEGSSFAGMEENNIKQ